ncbi:MAG: hypothetical protein GX800_10200 [Clostridiaceae bacterium]|nr:hypothetical protein [Clostridiaceae bacterium]
MSDCMQNPIKSKNCLTNTYQSADVSVPVSVRPKVNTGKPITFCCGEPTVTPSSCRIVCNDYDCSSGTCKYTITQKVCIEVPIEFGADATVGCPCIICGDVTTDICTDC